MGGIYGCGYIVRCGCKEVYRFPHIYVLLIPTPLVSALFFAASLLLSFF